MLLSVLLAAGSRAFAAGSAELRAFSAATNAFHLGFYDRAEGLFADYARSYTNAPRVAEAILYQAEARLLQSNYSGAIALLSTNQANAGALADQYLFWLAETKFRKADYAAAAGDFSRLVASFPGSARRLEAGIGEATARARLADWPAVVALLTDTNGFFQIAARTRATNDLVLQGYLLLSEANLARKDYPSAEAALQPLNQLSLAPETGWQRQYLLCQIQEAAGHTNEALQSAARLLTLATNTTQREWPSKSAEFQGRLLERMGRTKEAIAAYQQNLVEGAPEASQRQALWKVTELCLAQSNTAEAAEVLKRFLDQFPNAASADLALLTLGKIRLRQYLASQNPNPPSISSTNAAVETNYLKSALDSLQELVKRFEHSPLLGEAQLDRGWCYWLQTNLPQSQAAFELAVQYLPFSTNQAVACFKLADCQFRQNDFTGAITNYRKLIEKYADLPGVVTNLFETALYQMVQAGLAAGDLNAATDALSKLLAWYPEGFHTERALLLTGQEISRAGDPAGARKRFQDFAQANPGARLLPQLRLAIARTYEQEGDWTNAANEYAHVPGDSANASVQSEAEYYRAQATYQAGDATNALMMLTNFVAQYPTNELAPRAQMWVADYYYREGSFMQAEANYKMLFRNTNWPMAELTYQAQMMAGRAAIARADWGAARGYFTNLYNLTNCPTDVRVQALYAYGDCFISQDSTNKAADYQAANTIFNRIIESYPTNSLVALAWGGKANALFQWAKSSPQSADPIAAYGNVSNAFEQVILATNAPVAARSQAKVGLAITMERLADLGPATNRTALLALALTNDLDVFDGSTIVRDGEEADLFWRKEAGLQAARLAETLQLWPQAIRIYKDLADLIPAARARFDGGIVRCKSRLAGNMVPAVKTEPVVTPARSSAGTAANGP